MKKEVNHSNTKTILEKKDHLHTLYFFLSFIDMTTQITTTMEVTTGKSFWYDRTKQQQGT
jgi:hypothetical protein